MAINSVVLTGRAVRDAQAIKLPSGVPGARFILAVDRRVRRDENGNVPEGARRASFIPVEFIARADDEAGRASVENILRLVKKGRELAVSGELLVDSVPGDDGQWRTYVAVRIGRWQLLDAPASEQPDVEEA